jgi:hypothetical protein
MRSTIQDSLKEMRELGRRLIEIERVRYRLRRENAPRETFQDLDSRHRDELNLLKIYHRHFAIGIALAFFLVILGIFSGVVAMVSFRDENLTVGLIMTLCSISILYLGKREILG